MAAPLKLPKNLERARAAWGKNPPDWIVALAAACDASTQGKVGGMLGVSDSQINQVLGKVYKGRVDRVEARVRGEYMKAVVACPVLGEEISTRDCAANQVIARQAKYRPTNPVRVAYRKTCPTCPNREDK